MIFNPFVFRFAFYFRLLRFDVAFTVSSFCSCTWGLFIMSGFSSARDQEHDAANQRDASDIGGRGIVRVFSVVT